MPRSQPGELNPSARLTWADVHRLRLAYARGDVTFTDLARMFDINRSTATRVARGLTWQADKKECSR